MYAVYDLQVDPVNFDVFTFLVVAKSEGYNHILFVPGYGDIFDKPNKKQYSNDEKKFRLAHILYAACTSLDLTFTICSSRDHAEALLYGAGDNIFPYAYNIDKPSKETRVCSLSDILQQYEEHTLFWPQPSKHAEEIVQKEFPEPPVVITLRETYTEGRNSNLEEWLKFTDYVSKTNDVVFVRDTEKWNDGVYNPYPVEELTFPVASIDLDIRLALYQHAKINFSVGGGPTVLLHYSQKIPYRTFKIAYDGNQSSSSEFLTKMGFPPGSQFPWHSKDQQIIWEDDTFGNLKRVYDQWIDEPVIGEQ